MHFRLLSLAFLTLPFTFSLGIASPLSEQAASEELATLVQESRELKEETDPTSGLRLELIVTEGRIPQNLSYTIQPEIDPSPEPSEGPLGINPGVYHLIVRAGTEEVFKKAFIAATEIVSDLKLFYSESKGYSLKQTIDLPQVAFKPNQKQVSRSAKKEVERIADFLKTHETIETLGIEVHTDSHGDERSNLELTTFRAIELRNALVKQGVDAQRIKSFGKGSAEPKVPNDSLENRQLNRRIEYVILETSSKPRLLGNR